MLTDPTPFRIDRGPDVPPLEFDGWLIAEVDSQWRAVKTHSDSKERRVPRRPSDRWTEILIYATDTDKWVVISTGKSSRPGDRDLTSITVCDTPRCVQDAVRIGSKQIITKTSTKALTVAATADPRLKDIALTERI